MIPAIMFTCLVLIIALKCIEIPEETKMEDISDDGEEQQEPRERG